MISVWQSKALWRELLVGTCTLCVGDYNNELDLKVSYLQGYRVLGNGMVPLIRSLYKLIDPTKIKAEQIEGNLLYTWKVSLTSYNVISFVGHFTGVAA